MIPSSQKVGKALFKPLMVKGGRYSSLSFNARFFIDTKSKKPKFSVVVSKKIEKMAVGRNYIKRAVYSLISRFLNKVQPGTVCVFFIKKPLSRNDLAGFSGELKIFLETARLLL
jgi:ribonuclease P protein component